MITEVFKRGDVMLPMLVMSGKVDNIFLTPEKEGKDGKYGGDHKVQLLVDQPQENGEIVRLFVSKPTSTEVFPPSPPAGYPSPNGWHVGAWQANGRVYYLAVYAHRDSKLLYSRVIGSRINAA